MLCALPSNEGKQNQCEDGATVAVQMNKESFSSVQGLKGIQDPGQNTYRKAIDFISE
jgi:hypothetical protein